MTRRRFHRWILSLGLCVGLFASAHGASLDDYKTRIEGARKLAIGVENTLRNDEVIYSEIRGLVEHVRQNFKGTETVEWSGGAAEVSNEWLLAKTTAFEKETDLKKRLALVVEIRESLSAIAFKIQELESMTAGTRSKDEDKQKLAEILRREEYQKPTPQDESMVQRLVREFLEWLEGLFRFSAPNPSATPADLSALGAVLKVVIIGVLIVVIGFILYKVLPLIAPRAGRVKKKKSKDRVILGERIAEDETALDLLAEADKLAREGNLRGAIRKGYIALLCELSDRKILGLARHKTNRDYLRDVRSRGDLHPRMKVITDTFERHWYGFQESDERDWSQFRNDYEQALRSV